MYKTIAIFTTLCIGVFFSHEKKSKQTEKPNIIYILADDLGFGELGIYGQTKIKTPNIDNLARNGIRFTQHYSGAPVCAPSRCALITGLHMGHAQIRGNDEWAERGNVWDLEAAIHDTNLEGQRPLQKGTQTIGGELQKVGYKTAIIGKWGLGAPETEGTPNAQGFDYFFGYNCQRQAHNLYPKHLWENDKKVWLDNEYVVPHKYKFDEEQGKDLKNFEKFIQNDYAPAKMLDAALEFIEFNKESPFFLYFASPLPHVPLQVPQAYIDPYIEKFGPEQPYLGQQGYFPHPTPRAAYAGMVTYLDEQVGKLVNKLKEIDQYENTVIIFSSDNGPTYNGGTDSPWFNSAGPFNDSKGWTKGYTHEGGIRVPLIVSWPGKIKANEQSDIISAMWDIMPTVLDIAGHQPEQPIDGKSLKATLFDKQQKPIHKHLYWEFPSYGGQQAVRLNNWKGIRKNLNTGNVSLELYNLKTDPKEEHNVANLYPEIVSKIEAIMSEEHLTAEIKKFRIKVLDE